MTIGEKIKKLRKENGLTQKQLSELTDIPVRTIQRYEAGDFNPKMKSITKIADALKVAVTEFSNVGGSIFVGSEVYDEKRPYFDQYSELMDLVTGIGAQAGVKIAQDEELHLRKAIYFELEEMDLEELGALCSLMMFLKRRRADLKDD